MLRLLGQGTTNPEIAASLFISPRTAGVHGTHILRKLDATTRVQAATVAERAGLLSPEPTHQGHDAYSPDRAFTPWPRMGTRVVIGRPTPPGLQESMTVQTETAWFE